MNPSTSALAQQLGDALLQRHWSCTVAESCTGGLVAAAITEISGSSQWFDRGFVTYTNLSKTELLGVPPDLIASQGAVSEAVVRAMAEGALAASQADVSVAISGIAGPGGGSPEKPVGTVWFACASRHHKTTAVSHCFKGDRAAVRSQAVWGAINTLVQRFT